MHEALCAIPGTKPEQSNNLSIWLSLVGMAYPLTFTWPFFFHLYKISSLKVSPTSLTINVFLCELPKHQPCNAVQINNHLWPQQTRKPLESKCAKSPCSCISVTESTTAQCAVHAVPTHLVVPMGSSNVYAPNLYLPYYLILIWKNKIKTVTKGWGNWVFTDLTSVTFISQSTNLRKPPCFQPVHVTSFCVNFEKSDF